MDVICRLCIKTVENDTVDSIFTNNSDEDISLSEKIKICTSVEVYQLDWLPAYICGKCKILVEQSYQFQKQCVQSDLILKNFLQSSNHLSLEKFLSTISLQEEKLSPDNELPFITDDVIENNKEDIRLKHDSNKVRTRSKVKHEESEGKLAVNVCEKYRKRKVKLKKGGIKLEIPDDNVLPLESMVVTSLNSKSILNQNEDLALKTEILTVELNVHSPISTVEDNIQREEEEDDYWEKTFGDSKIKSSRGRKPKKDSEQKAKPPYFTCEHCQKVYPSEGGWRYHIHTIHNVNFQPFICDLCGKSFKVKKNLESHKNSIHFHLKQHLCDLCGRGFASKYALKVHKIWHLDEKNFACDTCGAKFRTRGKLNTHKSIHGGPKNFMCEICSRSFRWKKDFEIHQRTHTGEKPFKCCICGKAFASLTNMKKHEKNHTGENDVVSIEFSPAKLCICAPSKICTCTAEYTFNSYTNVEELVVKENMP